jgi:hypothetical protein
MVHDWNWDRVVFVRKRGCCRVVVTIQPDWISNREDRNGKWMPTTVEIGQRLCLI